MTDRGAGADGTGYDLGLGTHTDGAVPLQQAHEVLSRAREQGDPAAVASALVSVARARFRLGRYGAAASLAEEALALAAAESPARVDAWQLMANCAAETDSLAEAERLYRQAADLAREIGYQRGRIAALHGLAAGVYIPRGRFDLALAADLEAHNVAESRGEPQWRIYPLATIAMTCQLTGRRGRAREALDALGALVAPGSIVQGYHLCILAALALDEGRLDGTRAILEQARSIAETTGEPWINAAVRLGMSRYHRLRGEGPAARDWANDALAFVSRVGYRHEQGKALVERARAAWLCGALAGAEADLRTAMDILAGLGADFDLARARLLWAALQRALGHPEAAAALVEAAAAIAEGGYGFLLEQERAVAFPVVAACLGSPDPPVARAAGMLIDILQRVPAEPLHIVMLGRFEVRQGRRLIPSDSLRQRRAADLLALLLLCPAHRLPVDQVLDALWPDKTPRAATGALHQATSALRRALEPDLPDKFPSRYLRVEEGQVALCLPPGSSIDAATFEAHFREGRWEEALPVYGGDLLPAHRYAEWTLLARESLLLKYQHALLAAARARLDAGQPRQALEACHRLLAIEPWQEQVVLLGMRAYQALGDVAGARRLYLALEGTLRRDLDTRPQAELREFYRSLVS